MPKEVNRKLSSYRITVLRTAVQAISFALIFGGAFGLAHTLLVLPVMIPAGNPYTTTVGAWQFMEILVTAAIFPFLAIAVILLASVTVGRLFCGWVCPFGFISDIVSYIGRGKGRVVSKKTNESMYGFALFLAAVLLFIDFSIGYNQARGTSIYSYFGPFAREPYSLLDPMATLFSLLFWYFYWGKYPKTLGDIIDVFYYPGAFWFRVLLAIFAIAVNLAVPRAWCRWVCPLGAVKGVGSKYKLLKVVIDARRCVGPKACNLCEKVCPMGVPILDFREKGHIAHPLCISCLMCADVCPYKAIRLKLRVK